MVKIPLLWIKLDQTPNRDSFGLQVSKRKADTYCTQTLQSTSEEPFLKPFLKPSRQLQELRAQLLVWKVL